MERKVSRLEPIIRGRLERAGPSRIESRAASRLARSRLAFSAGEGSGMDRFWNWMLVLGGAALILLEVALGGFAGFDLVLIGSAFMLGGGIGLWLENIYLGMFTAGVLCAAYILVGRRWVRRRFLLKIGGHKSGADAAMGRRALVLARIAP